MMVVFIYKVSFAATVLPILRRVVLQNKIHYSTHPGGLEYLFAALAEGR